MPEDVNYARGVFKLIKEASTAVRKVPASSGAIVYTTDYANLRVSGSFVFPLIATDDAVTGGINLEIEDFLTDPTPTV